MGMTVERILSRLEVDITNCHLDLAKLKAKQMSVETPAMNLQYMMEYNTLKEKLRTLNEYKMYIKD